MKYKTVGRLQYYHKTCNLWLDSNISNYYRALCPKSWCLKPPMAPSHISVIRNFEIISNKDFWGLYEGELIEIEYWLPIKTDCLYYWLEADSKRIAEIRIELGLESYRINGVYHITIANTKE